MLDMLQFPQLTLLIICSTIDQSDSRLGFANIHHRGTLLHKED
jgi:hypothetical protein